MGKEIRKLLKRKKIKDIEKLEGIIDNDILVYGDSFIEFLPNGRWRRMPPNQLIIKYGGA